MIVADLPPLEQDRIVCSISAAEAYAIPADIMLAIAEADGCYSFYLAAWRIASHIKNDKGSIWQKSANYHSRTPKYNLIYQKKLISSARKWALWLNKHFTTVNLQKEEK